MHWIFTRKIIVSLIVICALLSAAIPISTAQDDAATATIPLRITILFDNTVYDGDLEASWGFAAIIERGEHTLLFDTGADGDILLRNMAALDFDPRTIDTIVLSHNHFDHMEGLPAVLATGVTPPVYVLPSFPGATKDSIAETTEVIDVERGQEVAPGIFTTGEIRGNPREQALVIPTDEGLIVITGCAHPGIATITAQGQSLFADSDQPIRLVMGGFHLINLNEQQVDTVIADLRDLDVQDVMPTHCTGDLAIARFAEVLGEHYIEGGVGRVLEFEVTAETNDTDSAEG